MYEDLYFAVAGTLYLYSVLFESSVLQVSEGMLSVKYICSIKSFFWRQSVMGLRGWLLVMDNLSIDGLWILSDLRCHFCFL